MRRHIGFEASPAADGEIVFRVRFSYPDPQKAQRTANALSLRFLRMPIAGMASGHAARNADIVSAAVVPNRAGFLVAGLVLSLAISAVRRWPGQASR